MTMLALARLRRPPADLIGGVWTPIGGDGLRSRSPSNPAEVVYACQPRPTHVDAAVQAARRALPAWSRTPREARFAVLRRYAELARRDAPGMAELLCDEIGKVKWEAEGEAGLLAGKVDITLDASQENNALRRVTPFDLGLGASRRGSCGFHPHGVMAVLGPFNFPAHLPSGHIVPALAMGNTVVFKPSDKAPGVGQRLAELFDEALREVVGERVAPGVLNLVQGGADIAARLTSHDGLDAIALTGSWAVGRRVLEANLDRPGRMIALELGGNNAAIVMPDADLRQAAVEIVRSAFTTAGQRCTCTRRAILHQDIAPRLLPAICRAASALAIGPPRASPPAFMGPMIGEQARQSVMDFQTAAARAGAEVLLEARAVDAPWAKGGWYLSPGVLRVPRFTPADAAPPAPFDPGCDAEVFGPLLRVSVARDLDDALAQAGATRFGLAASIFTREPGTIDRFLHEVRAGCLNVNTGTAGASSKLPFGGLGVSGNHRPAGSFALDYCAYPVASMIEEATAAALPEGLRWDAGWL